MNFFFVVVVYLFHFNSFNLFICWWCVRMCLSIVRYLIYFILIIKFHKCDVWCGERRYVLLVWMQCDEMTQKRPNTIKPSFSYWLTQQKRTSRVLQNHDKLPAQFIHCWILCAKDGHVGDKDTFSKCKYNVKSDCAFFIILIYLLPYVSVRMWSLRSFVHSHVIDSLLFISFTCTVSEWGTIYNYTVYDTQRQ